MLRPLHLYMNQDGNDLHLGLALLDDVPRVGDLLAHVVPRLGVTWRVVLVFRHTVQPGSYDALNDSGQPPAVDIFVEPASGPFKPGLAPPD